MTSATSPGLGVAMIGYAFMGRAHSNAWRNVRAFYPEVPQARQQVIVGRDADRVRQAADQFGWAEAATDWQQVVRRDDIQIVDICTPGQLHAPVAIAALEAGKHVIVEKPLANTLAEAEQIAAAAQRARASGVHSMVGFNYRRVPALALARRLIRDGRLGQVRQLRLSYLQDWLVDPAAPMTWRLRKDEAGSGVLGDLGAHAVDQAHWLLGESITSVCGQLRTFVPERPDPDQPGTNGRVSVDDAVWATGSTASGAVVSLEASRMATGRKNALSIEVYGTDGGLRFDLERLNELQVTDTRQPAEVRGWNKVLVTEPEHEYLDAWWPPGHILGWDHTFTSQIADFLRAVGAGTAPEPSVEDGLSVQAVLEAIEASSAKAGSRVDVSP